MQTSRVQIREHSHCSLLLTEYWTFLYLLKKRVRSQKIGYLKTHVSWVHFSEMFYSLKLSLFFSHSRRGTGIWPHEVFVIQPKF